MTTPTIFGRHDDKTLAQLRDVASRAERVALMADGHLGYLMPIGGVAAYDNRVSVAGNGFDIACGNIALRTDLLLDSFRDDLPVLADEIAATISFGLGRSNRADDAPIDHPLFRDPAWEIVPAGDGVRDRLRSKARAQLGTVGSGNHYVDIFADRQDRIWVGAHFGSRGLGHTIASSFMALAQGKSWGERVRETEGLLSLTDDLGRDYWALMELAGAYAYAGRDWVARKVVDLLGGTELERIHNHHNFAWREQHDGRDLVVVRKGATPAFPGQQGFVGGSMGDDAVILRGVEAAGDEVAAWQRAALYSTVHGAGRVMSRTQAAGKWDWKNKVRKTEGAIKPEMVRRWLDERGVVLRGGGLDEAPQVYRRLPEVIEAQKGTVEVVEVLRPLVVVMAGEGDFDPYRD